MIYTIIPIEEITASTGNDVFPEHKYIEHEGKTLCVEKSECGDMRIVSLMSTDPMDYLDASFAPGTIIEMKYK